MSDVAALIADLVRAGVDPDLIGRTAATIASAATNAPAQRTAGAIRQERYRRNKASQVTGSDVCDDLPSPEGSSPTPPSPKPLPSIPPSPPKGGSSPAEFDQFWSMYPNKVGKRDAEKAFSKAVKRADISIILAGLKAYVGKTDDRPWCNPATWLNQDRWEDAPADVPQRQAASPPQPRNVGEFTILESRRGDIFDAPFQSPRLEDESDRSAGFAGTGIARRIALAAAGRS